MSTNPPLSAARAGVPARQAGEQAQPMGIPTLVPPAPPAPPARPAPPLPRPEEPLNVTNELQSICGHGGKIKLYGAAGRPRPAKGAGERRAGCRASLRRGASPAPLPPSFAGRAETGGCRLRRAHPAKRGSAGQCLPAPVCAEVARRAEG